MGYVALVLLAKGWCCRSDGVHSPTALWKTAGHWGPHRLWCGQHGARICYTCCAWLRPRGERLIFWNSLWCLTILFFEGFIGLNSNNYTCIPHISDNIIICLCCSLAYHMWKSCARTAMWGGHLFSQTHACVSWAWLRSLGCLATTLLANGWCWLMTQSLGATPFPPSLNCWRRQAQKRWKQPFCLQLVSRCLWD